MPRSLTNSLVAIIDISLLVALFFLASLIRTSLDGIYGIPDFNTIALSDFLFVIFIVFSLMAYESIYRFNYDFWQDTLKIIKSFIFGFLIVLTLLALTKTNLQYSRTFLKIYFLL